jgi:putative hemolysin
MISTIFLVFIAVLTIVLSGLFAGAETGIYRLSQLRLRLGVEKKRPSFIILDKVVHDSARLILSLLVGNNLTHYLITSIITFILWKGLFDKTGPVHTVELFATLVTAPVLFIFAELIPKNVFFFRADSLMPFFAPLLFVVHKAFTWCGIVPLLRYVSEIFTRSMGLHVSTETSLTAGQRHHFKAIIADSHEEAILSAVQTNIITRLVNISDIRIRSVMTPINLVQMIDVNADKSALLKILEEHDFTRILVTDSQPTNIVGFINIYEALSSPEQFTNLRNFIHPIQVLPPDTTVIDALNFMRMENQKMILVTKTSHTGRGKPIGIVTMKDLVEELVGELTEW